MNRADAGVTVALNGRAAVRAQIGGVERYAREVSARLLALAPQRYRWVAPPGRFAHRAGHLWEQCLLPWQTREDALVYSPANLAPLASGDNVVVIHDTAVHSQPAAYSATYRAYQHAMLPAIARRARLVITVSEFSRGEIIAHLGAAPERVVVAPPGVEERFSPAADAVGAARELSIVGPYVLGVGTSSARKNHASLAQLAVGLRERGIALLLAGSDREYLRSGELVDDRVKRLGYVDERLLPGLYAGALALVMPSLYEGFGLPCIEAMASGIPVVAADAGALPETCGPAAVLVDPHDAGQVADAVLGVVGDAGLRRRLVDAGLERATTFRWERTAGVTHAAIEALLSR